MAEVEVAPVNRKRRALAAHLNVPWTVWQATSTFLLAWIALPLVIVLVLAVLAPYLPFAHSLTAGLQSGDVKVSFGLDLLDAAAALGFVALYLRRYHLGWASVGWRKAPLGKTVLYFVVGFVGFLLVATLLLTLVSLLDPSFNANQAQTNEYTGAVKTNRSLTLIALVLIPPIIEETVFRGFIFPAMAKKWGIIWGAIGSSALFGIAHLQANVSIYTFALGLVLCFFYVKLKSIFPGMAIHMLNNFLAFYALYSK